MAFDTVITSSITTKVSGAAFADGASLSGTWTANYNSTGGLVSLTGATFTVTGPGGTNTFTSMGTLPYAQDPTAAGFTSYEIHDLSHTGTGTYNSLYIDWKSETPSSLYEGSPSLFTSVKNSATTSPTAGIRLVKDGTTGAGSVPTITGLSANQTGVDSTAVQPFSAVTVTDSDSTTTTSATITLNANGVATDANGVFTINKTTNIGLTKIATGTYTLTATSPANLTAELQALKFTPTVGQVAIGNTITTLIGLSVNDADGSATSSSTLTETATCFLRATMIATPAGEVPVETLRVGDLVSVIEHGIPVARPVVWVGNRSMNVADFDHRDEAFPIRIREHAFADGVPHRDLLVTPEHCILTEAGLVPARMLVNAATILIDRSISSYEFFHVELETHGILLSEGLATESYLDTGNRGLFTDAQSATGLTVSPTIAAPLAVARHLVEPIWTGLAERARRLGFEPAILACTLTDLPDLRILLDDGREIVACGHDGLRHMFRIPRDTRAVLLLSRSAVPARVIGPFVDDRRTLGVAVDRLVFWTGLVDTVIPANDLVLDGWHALEQGRRWSNGRARIDLPVAGADTYLDVHVAATGLYPENVAA